jgi:hypothetical protein
MPIVPWGVGSWRFTLLPVLLVSAGVALLLGWRAVLTLPIIVLGAFLAGTRYEQEASMGSTNRVVEAFLGRRHSKWRA